MIKTEIEVYNPSLGKQKQVKMIKAIWDTGATLSAITPKVVYELGLIPDGKKPVIGISGLVFKDSVKVCIMLPTMELTIEKDIEAAIIDLSGAELLIGMDIIQRGDFAICNGAGKTLFTFAMPPFEDKIDLYEKAVAENKRSR